MSREDQIEEMAEVLRHSCDNECWKDGNGFADCEVCEACLLYEAGYRKQSEGEWVVEESPLLLDKKISCSCCGYSERRGPAWNISWGMYNFCPNCGAKMSKGER